MIEILTADYLDNYWSSFPKKLWWSYKQKCENVIGFYEKIT